MPPTPSWWRRSGARPRVTATSTPRLGARVAAAPPPGPPDGLSERELEVLRLIARGHTNLDIARQLFLSVRTVETHRAHIQQKLRLGSRAELVSYALEHGLMSG